MPKINSKAKGAAGERELSNLLKEHGYNTRRGGNNPQFWWKYADVVVVKSLSNIFFYTK